MTSTNDDGGVHTLRTLIAASVDGDTINFSVAGTITLTNQLVINHSLTIIGPGSGSLTVSGKNASSVFFITSGNTVSISGLTIANGHSHAFSGGGIFNAGTLTVSNCTLSGNTADTGYAGGGIFNGDGGTLTMDSCSLSGNTATIGAGGGIANEAGISTVNHCTLNDCTLSGNAAESGGGIANYSSSTLTLNNCTLSANTANFSGGGMVNEGALTLNNCTLSANAAASDGGGLFKIGGDVTIHNTIIAGNTSLGGPDVAGPVTSLGHNLVGNTAGSIGFGAAGDLLNVNPLLGPLQDNGGPTFTMAPLLQPISAAIDAGDDAVTNAPYNLTTDQRGLPRKSGAHVDIGAFEVNPPVTRIVTVPNDSGPGSLRQAILDAAALDSITFALGGDATITLTTGELLIDKSLVITGPTNASVTVSGNNTSRIFNISTGTVAVSGLTIANGLSNDGGGVHINAGTVSFSACNITSNSVQSSGAIGGGIFIYSGNVTLDSCTISHNSAGQAGGGINNANRGVLTLLNCTVSSNRTIATFLVPSGGGIDSEGLLAGQLTLINTTVTGNSSMQGGGIFNGGHAVLRSSLIAGNNAATAPDLSGTFDSSGYNLIGKTNGCTLTNAVTQNLVGSIATPLNPLLGPLADNGGPTFTHALLTGSPAIDKGNSPGLATDQRGRQRPYDFAGTANAINGDGSDIGAFELNLPILNISRAANNVVLSWSASDAGFALESTRALRSPPATNTWTAVPGTPAVVSGNYRLTNNASVSNKLYRLKSQ